MQCTYQDIFSTAQKFFSVDFDAFNASAVFCFTSSTSAQCFPVRTLLIQGNKNKSPLGQNLVNREGGAQGSCCFWSKTAEHSARCGRYAHKSPIMKWANALRVFNKNLLKPNAASHNNVSWYMDTDGFLEAPT